MPSLIYSDLPGALPASYTVPPGGAVRLESVSASFDGVGASGTFLACLAAYSQDGKLIGRWFPSQTFLTGDTGEVSYGPFLGGDGGGSGGITPVVASGVFEPATTLLEITSVDPANGTPIISSSSFTADGVSSFRIDLAIATADIIRTAGGNGVALLLHLLRNGTELGIIADWNLPQTTSNYVSFGVNVSVLDLPPAGPTTYSITGVKFLGAATAGKCFVYGDGIFPPVVGTTHPGFIAVYDVGVI